MTTDEFFAEAKRLNLRMLGTPEETRAALDLKDAEIARLRAALALAANRMDVTDDFIRYAQPLIGEDWVRVPLENGLQRFARLERRFAAQKLPAYTPQAYHEA